MLSRIFFSSVVSFSITILYERGMLYDLVGLVVNTDTWSLIKVP